MREETEADKPPRAKESYVYVYLVTLASSYQKDYHHMPSPSSWEVSLTLIDEWLCTCPHLNSLGET